MVIANGCRAKSLQTDQYFSSISISFSACKDSRFGKLVYRDGSAEAIFDEAGVDESQRDTDTDRQTNRQTQTDRQTDRHTHARTHAHTRTHARTNERTHARARTHARTHTHTHTHTHTQSQGHHTIDHLEERDMYVYINKVLGGDSSVLWSVRLKSQEQY